jgi:hypothetical protein
MEKQQEIIFITVPVYAFGVKSISYSLGHEMCVSETFITFTRLTLPLFCCVYFHSDLAMDSISEKICLEKKQIHGSGTTYCHFYDNLKISII